MSDSTNDQTIYIQRYETYRHLDRLRWLMFQIAAGAASIVLALGAKGTGNFEWWASFLASVLFGLLALSTERINRGISANADVLREFGKRIGDKKIPPESKHHHSSSFWMVVALATISIGLFLISMLTLRGPTA